METATALKLLLTVAVLMLYPQAESQWLPRPRIPRPRIPRTRAPRHPMPVPIPIPDPKDSTLPPLCASQFALVTRACATLPYTPLPPPSPPSPTPEPTPPEPTPAEPSPPEPTPPEPSPPEPTPPEPTPPEPTPPEPTPPEPTPEPPTPTPEPPCSDGNRRHCHGHGHGHEHEHEHGGHRHGHQMIEGTPVEEECCRWLESVDDECVCALLVRLPSFLTRPIHNYSVSVGETCSVTYACSSRIVPV